MAKFRDELLKLANPTPIFKDPEENSDDDTAAKLVEHDEDYSVDAEEASTLRSKVATILSDTDKRYAGKRTSRRNLGEESETDGLSEEDADIGEDQDEAEDEEMESLGDEEAEGSEGEEDSGEEDHIASFQTKVGDTSRQSFTFSNDGDYSKYGDDGDDDVQEDDDDDDDDDDSDQTDDDDDDEGDDDDSDIEDDMDKEGGGIMSFTSTGSEDVAKGDAAKQQLGLWDSLLEGRIKLQKAVSLVNQLPQEDNWQQFTHDSPKFAEESGKAQQAVKHLLDSLVHLQDLMLAQNKETSHMVQPDTKAKTDSTDQKPDKPAAADSEDEEIPSDSEEEGGDKPAAQTVNVRKRKLKMDTYPGLLKQRHDTFLSYRDATIQKWYDRTRLAGGGAKGKSFSAFDQSALMQINQILADRDRLIRRTQLKRSVYRVLGTKPKPEDPELVPGEELEEDRVRGTEDQKDYDEEIFDDDDFYHQLLRELIEKKASDTNDPVALSRQWLEIQKLRTKSKRKVDTRASKGRKIRYHVHKKLVNFMAPLDTCAWSHEARDDLFKSLFGKRFETSSST